MAHSGNEMTHKSKDSAIKLTKSIRVPKKNGEQAIILANKLKIINKNLRIDRNKEFIYIPLESQPSEDEVETLKKEITRYKILPHDFAEKRKDLITPVDLLSEQLPAHLLTALPHAIDFVGDIAMIELSPELHAYKTNIGNAILKTHKNTKSVLTKVGAISGTYRVRQFEVIAGEPRTTTIHKEHGCVYHVDLAKAYFSPRLSYEHSRVASLVQEGETVVDMFTGVGPFAVLIAKKHSDVKVYAIDVNPDAVEYLRENVRANRIEDKVSPILGDAKEVIKERLSEVADRVIMNLPERSLEFVDAACQALKSDGGVVHFYGFVNASVQTQDMEQHFANAVRKSGRKLKKILNSRLARGTAPYEWQAVWDANVL
jgi:tRNA (guanine37-N1)-methyltransferase